MFPISVEGAVDIPEDGADAALDRLGAAVAAEGATSIEQQANKLAFKGLVFTIRSMFGLKRSPLSLFDRCEISIQSDKIKYRCSTRNLLVMVTMMVIYSGLIMLSIARLGEIPFVLLFFWLVMFGLNYVEACSKMRNFLAMVVTAAR
jgi:hypothetical protein